MAVRNAEVSFLEAEFHRLSEVYHNNVGPFVEPGQAFALMDFPNHDNVGDSAIWAGELAFFDNHVGRTPSFVNTEANDPAHISSHLPDGPIFLHGGGNFGDVWQRHQAFRIRAMEALKGRQIVQLPQSIHFDHAKNVDVIARAIEAHGQFVLMVRDKHSFDFAQKHFNCEIKLCPDAAVNLFPLQAPAPNAPLISYMRKDREAVWEEARAFLEERGDVTDWSAFNVWRMPDRIKQKLFLPIPKIAMKHRQDMYRRHANWRVENGVAGLSSGEIVVTDRLHVHLLSALIGRPHVVMDNKYGKIDRHITAWSDFGLAHRVSDLDDLKNVVEKLLSQK